jgi:hypothetical protein
VVGDGSTAFLFTPENGVLRLPGLTDNPGWLEHPVRINHDRWFCGPRNGYSTSDRAYLLVPYQVP